VRSEREKEKEKEREREKKKEGGPSSISYTVNDVKVAL